MTPRQPSRRSRLNLRKLDGVELVEADTAWVRRLHAIEDTMQQLVLLVAAVLAAGVLAVVGNTIRLEINSRRAEIEVTKLVGGSNAFVRRPFLYSGIWQGLGGGLLAVGLVAAGLMALEPFVARLAAAYGAQFALKGLSIREWPAARWRRRAAGIPRRLARRGVSSAPHRASRLTCCFNKGLSTL